MKYSEAILLGAMNKPQGGPCSGERHYEKTCANGAARDAMQSDFLVSELWPWTTDAIERCPDCGLTQEDVHPHWSQWRKNWRVVGIVTHLNNDHQWTRERIAIEFVRPLEVERGMWDEEVFQEEVKQEALSIHQ